MGQTIAASGPTQTPLSGRARTRRTWALVPLSTCKEARKQDSTELDRSNEANTPSVSVISWSPGSVRNSHLSRLPHAPPLPILWFFGVQQQNSDRRTPFSASASGFRKNTNCTIFHEAGEPLHETRCGTSRLVALHITAGPDQINRNNLLPPSFLSVAIFFAFLAPPLRLIIVFFRIATGLRATPLLPILSDVLCLHHVYTLVQRDPLCDPRLGKHVHLRLIQRLACLICSQDLSFFVNPTQFVCVFQVSCLRWGSS